MTDTKRIRELCDDYTESWSEFDALQVANNIIDELPALLDKADKYDSLADSIDEWAQEHHQWSEKVREFLQRKSQ